jgi:hypothetical protein
MSDIRTTITALSRLATDAQVIDVALQQHCRATVGQHDLHGRLHALQIAVADFRLSYIRTPKPRI